MYVPPADGGHRPHKIEVYAGSMCRTFAILSWPPASLRLAMVLTAVRCAAASIFFAWVP